MKVEKSRTHLSTSKAQPAVVARTLRDALQHLTMRQLLIQRGGLCRMRQTSLLKDLSSCEAMSTNLPVYRASLLGI